MNCSSCDNTVKKSPSPRTHKCSCGAELCRDVSRFGNKSRQGGSLNQESPEFYAWGVSNYMVSNSTGKRLNARRSFSTST
ncbi:hypothetical protein [Gloeocapsopsis dulcis]|uniref:hypothetical protein n=1 Tax=Gloeocapsopsis dulcis TaxID=2859516 RepID=UPI0039C8A1D0